MNAVRVDVLIVYLSTIVIILAVTRAIVPIVKMKTLVVLSIAVEIDYVVII